MSQASASKRVYIVRHGETDSNAARIIQTPDAGLSAEGREQAQKLAARMAQAAIARIVSSDYPRAEQTAAAVAARTKLAIEFELSLRERDFGDLRGRSYDSLGFNPFAENFTPPNGESRPMFKQRVALAWERVRTLAQETDGSLLVVTHGQVCRALVQFHIDYHALGDLPPMWFNTSVTEVVAQAPWSATRMNCIAHL
jgi:probable phosphoglycerate mutase